MLRLCPLLLACAVALGCAREEPDGELTPVGLALPTPPPPPGRPISASLERMVRYLPSIRSECRPVRFPSAAELIMSRQALRHLLRGETDRARALYALLGFEVLEAVEGERRYLVVRESPGAAVRGWGFYVVNPHWRRPLVLEAPHPVHDWRTGIQAAEWMTRLGARALLVATTHRCASKHPTSCQGRTGACRQVWGRGRYRRSDRAHATNTLFHAAHMELLEGDPRLVAMQIHGFRRRPGRRRHIILSDGTRLPGRRDSRSNGLARQVRRLMPPRRRRLVASCNETSRQRYLCGTHNVQGRHANGSTWPCRRPARHSLNRFIQIEQSMDARKPGGLVEDDVLVRAIERYWLESKAPPVAR